MSEKCQKQKRSEPLITAQCGGENCSRQAGATSDDIGTSSVYTKPVGSYASWTWPFNCWPRDSIKRVPKLCRDGARTEGPPFSVQVSCSRLVPSSIFHAMSMLPAATDSAPNFVVLVQSSFSVIARAITAPDVILMSGPAIENHPALSPRGACVQSRHLPISLAKTDHAHDRARPVVLRSRVARVRYSLLSAGFARQWHSRSPGCS